MELIISWPRQDGNSGGCRQVAGPDTIVTKKWPGKIKKVICSNDRHHTKSSRPRTSPQTISHWGWFISNPSKYRHSIHWKLLEKIYVWSLIWTLLRKAQIIWITRIKNNWEDYCNVHDGYDQAVSSYLLPSIYLIQSN